MRMTGRAWENELMDGSSSPTDLAPIRAGLWDITTRTRSLDKRPALPSRSRERMV